MPLNYRLASNFLSALSFTLDNAPVLTGLADGFSIQAPGAHQVFPYNQGGSTYNTSSTETPAVGSLSFRGLLLEEIDGIRDLYMQKLGDMTLSANLKVVDFASSRVLMSAKLWDLRLGRLGISAQVHGNTVIMAGEFAFTFRKFVPLPV